MQICFVSNTQQMSQNKPLDRYKESEPSFFGCLYVSVCMFATFFSAVGYPDNWSILVNELTDRKIIGNYLDHYLIKLFFKQK